VQLKKVAKDTSAPMFISTTFGITSGLYENGLSGMKGPFQS